MLLLVFLVKQLVMGFGGPEFAVLLYRCDDRFFPVFLIFHGFDHPLGLLLLFRIVIKNHRSVMIAAIYPLPARIGGVVRESEEMQE